MKQYQKPTITNLHVKETCENGHPCPTPHPGERCGYLAMYPNEKCNYKGEQYGGTRFYICNYVNNVDPYNP